MPISEEGVFLRHLFEVLPRPASVTTRPIFRIRNLLQSRFLRHNAIFLAGAIAVGALNYAYYPIMGRILQPASFGEVQTLFSVFAQIAIFMNVISMLTVTIVSNYDNAATRNRMVSELEKVALLISSSIVVIAAISAPWLQSFFQFEHALPFVLLTFAVLAATPFAFRSGYLRGKQKFGLVTITSIAASSGNLLFSAGLALAGFGVTGALLGLVIGQTIGFVLAAIMARRQGLGTGLSFSKLHKIDFSLVAPELRYALMVLVGSLAITSLYSLDTIVVKHYFDAHTAGLYAGIATVARIVFFATASVIQVMMPSIKRQQTDHENSRILLKSLGLLVVIGGLPLLLFSLFPERVINLLMGSEYLHFANLLPWLGLTIFLVAILNLVVMYHIVLRRFTAAWLALGGIAFTYILIFLHHQSVDQIVGGLFAGTCVSLFAMAVWSGRHLITQSRGRLGNV